jgi:hypothetical protein
MSARIRKTRSRIQRGNHHLRAPAEKRATMKMEERNIVQKTPIRREEDRRDRDHLLDRFLPDHEVTKVRRKSQEVHRKRKRVDEKDPRRHALHHLCLVLQAHVILDESKIAKEEDLDRRLIPQEVQLDHHEVDLLRVVAVVQARLGLVHAAN